MHGLLDENSRSGIFEGPVWNFYRSSLIRRQQARAGDRQTADEVASVHPAPGDGGRCWVPSSSGKRGRAGVAGPLLSQIVEASALECEAETLSLCKPECNSASVFTQTGMPTTPGLTPGLACGEVASLLHTSTDAFRGQVQHQHQQLRQLLSRGWCYRITGPAGK